MNKFEEDRNYKVKIFVGREPCEINVLEWGDTANGNVLLCLHGLTRSARDFSVLASFFKKKYRVICPNLVGRGDSSWLKNKANYHMPFYLLNILVLINELKLKKADIIGTSLGGVLAMLLSATHKSFLLDFFTNEQIKKIIKNLRPIEIGSLVLNDVGAKINFSELSKLKHGIHKLPSSFNDFGEAQLYIKKEFENALGFHTDSEWRLLTLAYIRYDERKHCFVPHFDPGILNPFNVHCYAPHFDPGILNPFNVSYLLQEFSNNGLGLLPDLNLWKYYDSISVRTMLLRGKKSSILNHELAQDMTGRGPKPALIEFEGVGHAPSLMRSEQINAVTSFLCP